VTVPSLDIAPGRITTILDTDKRCDTDVWLAGSPQTQGVNNRKFKQAELGMP